MMTSTVKEPYTMFSSNTSRSGVVVGYKPEDTMRSLLFNQKNRHTLLDNNDGLLAMSCLPKNEIERALEYLSSDTESESSSLTKSTVKDVNTRELDYDNFTVSDRTKDLECITPQNFEENQPSDSDFTDDNDNDYGVNRDAEIQVFGDQKSFEEILEEKLRQESQNHQKTTSRLKPESTRNMYDSNKPKFHFLRKNQGKSAWSCNLGQKNATPTQNESLHKQRSQSSDRQTNSNNKNVKKPPIFQQAQSMQLKKPISNSNKFNSAQISATTNIKITKNNLKNVHFASSCEFNDSMSLLEKELNQPESSHTDSHLVERDCSKDKELVEFELLEQIANVSISSTVSSIARLDENKMREKLNSIKTMPPPSVLTQMKHDNDRRELIHRGSLLHDNLSICDEANEEIESSNNYNSEMFHCEGNEEEDEEDEDEERRGNEKKGDNLEESDEEIEKHNLSVDKDISQETTSLSEYVEPYMPNRSSVIVRKISKQTDPIFNSFEITGVRTYNDDGDGDGDGDNNERNELKIPKLGDKRNSSNWMDSSPFCLNNTNSCNRKTIEFFNGAKGDSSHDDRVKVKPWTFADPFKSIETTYDDDQMEFSDEEEDDDKHKNMKNNRQVDKIFPNIPVDNNNSLLSENVVTQSAKLKQWVQLLEKEIKKFNVENEEIAKLKKEREEGLKRLEQEMLSFSKHKSEELQKIEDYKQNEMKKLKKERKVFEEYQEAMKNMPNKKDRQEIERLKAEIACLKEETGNKETRWQSANSRLKQRIEQLETDNNEMRSRIHALEQKRLQLQAQLVSVNNQGPGGNGKCKLSESGAPIKQKPTVTSVSQAISYKHSNIPLNTSLPKEDIYNHNRNNSNTANTNPPATFGYRQVSAKKSTNKLTQSLNTKLTGKLNKTSIVNGHPTSARNVTARSSLDDNAPNVRSSAASDYYTGEEEEAGGSQELRQSTNGFNNINVGKSNHTDSSIKNIFQIVKINRSNDAVKDEVKHPDGVLERIYISGGMDVVYPNGSLKQISSDGKSTIVHLFNGDIKQITPDGRVMYFYAQDESTQTTFPGGKEEIIYKNGHKEIIHPTGIREIHFPDESIKILHPDNTEENILSSGLIVKVFSNGDKEILMPNGQKEIHSEGVKKRIYPDGTTKTVYPDGRQETCYASGRYRVKDRDGNLIVDKFIDRSTIVT